MQDEITKGGNTNNPFWTDEFGQALKSLGGDNCQVYNDLFLWEDAIAHPNHEEWERLGDGYVVEYKAELLTDDFSKNHWNDITECRDWAIFITGEGRAYQLNYDPELLQEAQKPSELLDFIKSHLKVVS